MGRVEVINGSTGSVKVKVKLLPTYRYRREADAAEGTRWKGRPVRGLVLLQRAREALAGLLSSDPKEKFRETARILSPAMMQGWDIGETIRAMTCPQCLLEGFVLSSLFVSAPLALGGSGWDWDDICFG